MKNISLRKEYYWLEVDHRGNVSEPRQAGHFDGGYFYLNKSGIIEKHEALDRLEKYYEAGGSGQYILVEKYMRDNDGR
tara:strand:- start:647 stop:880 length:234 start_codon:yes stop_codon:yes gene_type:complete